MDLYKVRQQLNMGIPLTQIKLRVTDYSRVSTDHKEQKSSLKNQKDYFDGMITKCENWTYISGYVDDGISGTSDVKRDDFMRMIADAKRGLFDLIITKEISRFSRNTLDSIKYTRELLNYGVAVLFVNDNINTALPDSELRLTIMASMAQDEIRRLSERVKFGMHRAIENGHILGNDTLHGYKKDKLTGCLYIIEKEAEVVRRLYSMYAIEEISLYRIADIFNAEGIKTCRNRKWCVATLRRMIRNHKYKGYYCGKKTEIIDYMTKKVEYLPEKDWIIYEDKVRIPPIVTEELWDRANERLNRRAKRFGEEFKDKTMYLNRYPLSAKIYCGEHNEPFHRRKLSRNSDEIAWSCSLYLSKGKKVCNSPILRETELYFIFNDIIDKLSLNLEKVSNSLIDMYNNNKTKLGLDEKYNIYNKEKEKIFQKKDKLLELNLEGNISNAEFSIQNNKYNDELQKLDDNILELEKHKKGFIDINKKNDQLQKILNQKLKSKATTDKMIKLLLNKIVVSKINNDRNNVEVNIFFNFSKNYIKKETNFNLVPNTEGLQNFMREKYTFKRGYDKTGTKRYEIKYQVNSYLCI